MTGCQTNGLKKVTFIIRESNKRIYGNRVREEMRKSKNKRVIFAFIFAAGSDLYLFYSNRVSFVLCPIIKFILHTFNRCPCPWQNNVLFLKSLVETTDLFEDVKGEQKNGSG